MIPIRAQVQGLAAIAVAKREVAAEPWSAGSDHIDTVRIFEPSIVTIAKPSSVNRRA